jgi:predicted kinase
LPRLTILVGMPGSGKTTWAKQHKPGAAWVSSDNIRERYFEAGDQTHNAAVFSIFRSTIQELLRSGRDVVADATHLRAQDRVDTYLCSTEFTPAGPIRVAENHVIFFDNLDQAWDRNETREGWAKVPYEAMRKMETRLLETRRALPNEQSYYETLTVIKDFS